MGIQDLQAFLESNNLEGGAVSVDLLKIARNVAQRQPPHNSNRKIRPNNNKLRLIIDTENCLDRLYGGYFSDWTCGGQWNRMVQFLSLFIQAVERGNIELAVVFNGTIESSRLDEWIAHQANTRQRVGMILKHINTKATPPPKIWWTAPICLKTSLRMALRHLGVGVMCTMDDHHQEVISYCRDFAFHGLLADDAEYAAFNPPRYFSSEHLKLTYKGSLETKEYMLSELNKSLKLNQEQMCILAALLGNYLLPETELQDIYKRILVALGKEEQKVQGENGVKLLAEYVLTLPAANNLDAVAHEVFGTKDQRCQVFKQSIMYYLNGTSNGYLKYFTAKGIGQVNNSSYKRDVKKVEQNMSTLTIKSDASNELDTSGFASETTEQEQESLKIYKLATVNQVIFSDLNIDTDSSAKSSPHDESPTSDTSCINGHANGSSASSASNSNVTGDSSVNLASSDSSNLLVSSSSANETAGGSSEPSKHSNVVYPSVSADVIRTASLRHQKGLMCPWILHALSTKEVRLPCVMEDESNREFPPIHEIYKPLRQRIYAVLFNLHHLRYVHAKKRESKEVADSVPPPDVVVKEWVYSKSNPYQYAEEVKAVALPWAVPTLQRLWFGPSVDDKRRRMRALLSCLNSDTPLILNINYVPQHMLVMACVLRYIMSQEKPILRRSELDVFIAQAFNPDLMNTQYLQELTLNVVSSRGVQLAAVFMQGVEMTLLANDACGAPLPWLMCCPWLFFDGKLFHHTLTRSVNVKNISDLCENHFDRVIKVERMRKAILEGLDVNFAKVPIPLFTSHLRGGIPPPNCLPAMPLPSSRGTGAGGGGNMRHRPMQSRGGQLQVAGVVVGSWGANYGYHHQHHHQQQQQQQHHNQANARIPPPMLAYNRSPVSSTTHTSRGSNFLLPHYRQQRPNSRPRKPTGAPTYTVPKRNVSNVANKKKFVPKPRQPGFNRDWVRGNANAPRNDNGEVVPIKEETSAIATASSLVNNNGKGGGGGPAVEESVAFDECKGSESEHQGQGDGPSLETAC